MLRRYAQSLTLSRVGSAQLLLSAFSLLLLGLALCWFDTAPSTKIGHGFDIFLNLTFYMTEQMAMGLDEIVGCRLAEAHRLDTGPLVLAYFQAYRMPIVRSVGVIFIVAAVMHYRTWSTLSERQIEADMRLL